MGRRTSLGWGSVLGIALAIGWALATPAAAGTWSEGQLRKWDPAKGVWGSKRERLALAAQQATRVDELAPASNLVSLSRLIGVVPDRCEGASTTTKLCGWNVGNDLPGYELLSKLIGTDERIRVLCEVQLDGSDRAPDSCTFSVRD